MKVQYQFWSNEQKEQLYMYVKEHQNNQKIKWAQYNQQVTGKTQQQCKSYYTNVLKQQLEEQPSKFNQSVLIDLIYNMVTDGDLLKTRSQYNQLTELQFGEYIKQLGDIQKMIVLQLPHILKYPNTNFQFNYEILELGVLYHQKYPNSVDIVYNSKNHCFPMSKQDAYKVKEHIAKILEDRKFALSLKK
ncbi:SANT/Myb_domain [Hexamita inflata]|uniref:SANT/Myb domain n=1 Tax=Hexamita inflata TaxID=28002 RepID=A0AA86N3R6_9EUKA|nr:SANT/Myb domain [Hexamita inflata]